MCIADYKPQTSSLNKHQFKTMSDLKKNNTIVILPADKGNATVVMERSSYEQKVADLLDDDSYVRISKDPTKKTERTLNEKLKELERSGELDKHLRSRFTAQHSYTPQLYACLPKIHKPDIPLRPIVASIGSATYNLEKELARIISPLRGKTDSYVRTPKILCRKFKISIAIHDSEIMVSFDVKSLFTKVPMDEALEIMQEKLKNDETLEDRTSFSAKTITNLIKFCMKTTYFGFKDKIYQQLDGAPMGSPLSPIIADLYMEHFEQEAIQTSEYKPNLWLRYVDDTFSIWNMVEQDFRIF